jgi:hypothetical protein
VIEDRIREALDAEAARVVPHGNARAENIRRIARGRRRRQVTLPLLAAAATAVAVTVLVPLGHVLFNGDKDGRPAARYASIPSNLYPSYRPTGPIARDGSGHAWWFAGEYLCWRRPDPKGGGDCLDWNHDWIAQRKVPGSVTGVRPGETRGVARNRVFSWVVYGIAAKGVREVHLAGKDGMKTTATLLPHTGLRWRIWQATVEFAERSGPPNLREISAVFSSGGNDHATVGLWRNEDDTGRLLPASPVFPRAARPLTAGRPLFTYRYRDGGSIRNATVHTFGDGQTLGLGTDSAESASSSRDTFGTVRSYAKGPDAPWWYGYMGLRMTRVVAELNDGRKIPAKTVPVGRYRAFVVQLTGVAPKPKLNASGKLVGYDSAGRVVATWKI